METEEYQVCGPAYPWCSCVHCRVLQGAGLGSFIGTYCCPCKEKLTGRWDGGQGISDSKMRWREEMGCPRWLGLHVGGLGGPPSLDHVPLSRGRPLGRMPLLTCQQKPHALLGSPSSPEHMSGDEGSSEDELYTYSFTSHSTASGSTTADSLTSNASALEDNSSVQPLNVSPTESIYTWNTLPWVHTIWSDNWKGFHTATKFFRFS